MAAGRGEFYRSFAEGLRRLHIPLPPQTQGQGRASVHGRRKNSGAGREAVGGQGQREGRAAAGRTHDQRSISRLPREILMKILSYLDAPSLFCISHVNRHFHQLANDEVLWKKIYMSDFGHMWDQTTVAEDTTQEVQDLSESNLLTQPAENDVDQLEDLFLEQLAEQPVDKSLGHWKRLYFRTTAGQEINKWRKELKDISPYTGLPRQTESVLRNLNITWELTVLDHWGLDTHLQEGSVSFFESSLIICWSKCDSLCYKHISKIQLHGVKRLPSTSKHRPQWQSLIFELNTKTCRPQVIGEDKLMKLLHLSPGIVIGIWRGQGHISFFMVSLHFHKLVEKSLLGCPACPYSEVLKQPRISSDPELGLHGYTLHFVLHSTNTEIMSGSSRHLLCRTGQIQKGLLELIVIDGTNLSQHRPLSGQFSFPWTSNLLKGSVENCCVMTMTLMDEFQKPFWCVSSPVSIRMVEERQLSPYSGEHFMMEYSDADGKVKMELEWLKEEKQFFLVSLTIHVSLLKIKRHFGQSY